MEQILSALGMSGSTEQTPQDVAAPDNHSFDTIVFLAMKWQQENNDAARTVRQLQVDLDRSNRMNARLQEDQRYLQERLNRINDERTEAYGLTVAQLRRLDHVDLMDLLFDLFRYGEKIPAIKVLHQVEGMGLKEAKELIDIDWAARIDVEEMDEDSPDTISPEIKEGA